VFEEECARLRIPPTYRTEAIRLELLRNLEVFVQDRRLSLGWSSSTELDFQFALMPELTIRGRIDRLDTSREGEALVIDYKYSAGNKVRERVEESEAGNLVQAGLYMLAAERAMGLKPIGMLYCGVKKETFWGGWRLQIAGLESIGEVRTRQELRELMEESAQRAREVHTAITTGKVAVRPLDRKKCAWCDFRDACRVETMAAEVAVAGTSRPG
jgi:ATP-dependent helicase/DNAse subunit B